jgi:hypothetical protein
MQSRKGQRAAPAAGRAALAMALLVIPAFLGDCGRGHDSGEGGGDASTGNDATASADTLDENRQKSDSSRDEAVPVEWRRRRAR